MSDLAVISSSMPVPFKGSAFFLNGKTYIVPSLSLRQFQANYEALTSSIEVSDGSGLAAQFDKYVPIILQAINRNYPEVTADDLYNWLDLATFREALLAVQGASGMRSAAPGE